MRVRHVCFGSWTVANTRDMLCRIALYRAAMGGNVEIARMPLDAGAQADAPAKSGRVPLSPIDDSADVAKLPIERAIAGEMTRPDWFGCGWD